MGGSIPIAARFSDGETICVDGWTNFMPGMIVNATTLSGDDSVVRKTLLEVAGHASYDGPQSFRSYGYGMVAIDFIAREIHSIQGYTSFDSRTLNQLVNLNASGWRGVRFRHVLSEEAEGLLAAGRVRMVARNGKACTPTILVLSAALALLSKERWSVVTGGLKWVDIEIDTAPFTVHEYPEHGSLTAMKARLRAAGFPMTKAAGLNATLAKTRR